MEQQMEASTCYTPEYRKSLLDLVASLLGQTPFTKENASRAAGYLELAKQIGATGELKPTHSEFAKAHYTLRSLLRSHNGFFTGRRDLAIALPTLTVETSVFAAQQFYAEFTPLLAAYDALFNDGVVRRWETATGSGASLPGIDVLDSAAQVMEEGNINPPDLTTKLWGTPLPAAPTYRTPVLLVSRELFEDTAFDIAEVLAFVHGLQFGLGIGPALVASLLSSAVVGAMAGGAASNTGNTADTASGSVGYADLVALRTSVSPAYRIGPRVGWMMNDGTLFALDSLPDKVGRPLLPQIYNAEGRRMILGYPVFLSPSFPSIGPSQTPIAFGNFAYYITRLVKESMLVRILQERYAPQGQIGYFSKIRCNGALLGCVNHGSPAMPDSPVKVLVNAAAA
jgi:HK97 family phage major capsid protein